MSGSTHLLCRRLSDLTSEDRGGTSAVGDSLPELQPCRTTSCDYIGRPAGCWRSFEAKIQQMCLHFGSPGYTSKSQILGKLVDLLY